MTAQIRISNRQIEEIRQKNGFIIGDILGGPEIANADEALGFLDKGG